MGLALFIGLVVVAGLAGAANAHSQRDRTQGRAGLGGAIFSGAVSGIFLFLVLAGGVFLAFLLISSA